MLERLEILRRQGLLEDADVHFARFMTRLAGDHTDALTLGALLASQATTGGHVCLDLHSIAGRPIFDAGNDTPPLIAPNIEPWMATLRASSVVGEPGERAPLVLDESGRLYLYRYWDYEQRLSQNLLMRLQQSSDEFDSDRLKAGLERLFPKSEAQYTDWQKIAAAVAVLKRFCVISGGPGTGKTTTVARLLALLIEQHVGLAPLRIALAAPTGKAAARLQESLRLAKPGINTDTAIKALIPEAASTLHRLLGVQRDSSHFRYGPDNLLPLDVLVVDEASMVDLALMTKLVEALPTQARLILLGDKDQLASVEAGAVLGDICAAGSGYSKSFAARLEALTGESIPDRSITGASMQDAVVVLHRSYRFGMGSGIGQLANAVNAGDARRALQVLEDPTFTDLAFTPFSARDEFESAILNRAEHEFRAYFEAVSSDAAPQEIIEALSRFRFLCAHRTGAYSAQHINQLITDWIKRRHRIHVRTDWYAGRPVMIARNDYNLRLFNGDIGVTLPDPAHERRLRVFFQSPEGGLRAFSPTRLPEHETVYAMTVHKSQGSEFDRVALVLPETVSGVTTRELIYTAVTRAKSRVELHGSEGVLKLSIQQVLSRASGLQQRLSTG